MSVSSDKASKLGLEWCREITNREPKEEIARQVAGAAQQGDVIGAGSGSTSFLTLLALGRRAKEERLAVVIVPTSIEIELAARAVGLTIASMVPTDIDWCFDGADEVDPLGRMIKGRGGALHRERLVFGAAKRRLIVADSSKSVQRLGTKFPVPIEVDPAWLLSVFTELESLSHVDDVTLRMGIAKDGPVITESGKLILDVRMNCIDERDPSVLDSIPGVCCTGLFAGFDFERIE